MFRKPAHSAAHGRYPQAIPRRGSMRRLAPRSGSPQAVCLRSYGCLLRSHPPHRSVPASRSLRGLRKPRSGSCSAEGGEEREEHPSMHVNQRFCTFVREDVDNLPALRAKRRPVFQSVSCREERPEATMWKTPACAPRIMNTRDGVLPSTTGGFRRRPAFMSRVLGETNRRSRTSLLRLSRSFC